MYLHKFSSIKHFFFFCQNYMKNLLLACPPPILFMPCIRSNYFICVGYLLPMSYGSTGASSYHNNGMMDEVVGSRPTDCGCNLPIKKLEKNCEGTSLFVSLCCYFFCCIECEECVLEDSLRTYWMCISSSSDFVS
jgi:hypothetical protein